MRRGASLNVFAVQNPEYSDRGIARYVAEHARGLLGVAPDLVHSLRASPDLALTENLVELLSTGLVQRTHEEPLDAQGRAPAIAHVTSPLEWGFPLHDVWPVWARRPDVATVVTLYDLIPHLFPERYLAYAEARVAYAARLQLVRGADHVFAISQCTADDAVRELQIPEERITVIDAAASSAFSEAWPRRDEAVAFVREQLPAIDRPFAFYVAGADPRKNIPGLMRAWGLLEPQVRAAHRLVITCHLSPAARGELERLAATAGLARDDFVLTGRVGERELAALYRACELFVFASLYEGSGLPILEAMMAGAPVLASRTGTGPEMMGDADAMFDPEDPSDMASAISRALTDPARLGALRELAARRVGRFSWNRVAERTAEGYETVLRKRSRRRVVRRLRPRIALVTPGPRATGPADDAWERLAELWRRHAEVELVRDGADSGATGATEFVLARRQGHFDHVAAVVGDTAAHVAAYEALVDGGGIAIFERADLSPFHRWYGGLRRIGPDWLRRTIVEQYGPVATAEIVARGYPTPEEATARGLLFTQALQRAAAVVVAPSTLAGRLLGVDRRGVHLPAPVLVAPPPLPPAARTPSAARGAGQPLLIGAASGDAPVLSLVGEHVQPDPLLVGATAPDWLDAPARMTPGMRASRLARAAVAILPAAVADARQIAFAWECVAAGVPIVAAGAGWAAELPAGSVALTDPAPTPAQLADAVLASLAAPEQAAARAAAATEHRAAAAADAERRWTAVLEHL
jgi:glycosyltransferase involved in cell wall biosynthesis